MSLEHRFGNPFIAEQARDDAVGCCDPVSLVLASKQVVERSFSPSLVGNGGLGEGGRF